jgi:hypothetical protein
MRELRARLSCLVSVFVSADVFLVLPPLLVLVFLVFACLCLSLVFAVVRLVSDERALGISGVEKFWPTPLYKSRLCT